jgi:hypothetical protein
MEVIQGGSGWPKKLKFVLEHDGNELELKYAPQGWRELEIQWQRDLKNSAGIYRTFAVPLRFVGEGAEFMRRVMGKGLEETVLLSVYRHTHDSRDWKYVLEFSAKAVLAETSDTELFFECPFTDEGLADYLNKHGGSKYEIPVGNGYRISVPDGVYLDNEVTLVAGYRQDTLPAFSTIRIPCVIVNSDVSSPSIKFEQDEQYVILEKTDDQKVTLNVAVALKFFVAPATTNPPAWHGPVTLHIGFASDTRISIYAYNFELSTQGNEFEIQFKGSVDIAEPKEYRLNAWIYRQGTENPIPDSIMWQIDPIRSDSNPDISFEYVATTAPFSFYGMPLYNLFQKMIEKIYPHGFSVASKLLTTGIGKDIYVTSGDGIRGFDNAMIKLTLADLVSSVSATLGADVAAYSNEYIVEEKSYFFDDTEIVNMGEVSEVEITVANDILANKITVGYPDKEYDERNGRDEFNITLNFEVKINNNSEKLELISQIRADSYGIQFTKINLEGKSTVDSDSDNDPFFVHVKHDISGAITVNKDIEVLGGSWNPDGVFNVLLSPKRCLLRNSGWIASIFDKINKDIEFISSDRQDSNLESSDGTTTITEKANVPLSSLSGDKLFIPYYAEFDAPVPAGIAGNNGPFAAKKFGYISFSVNGYRLKGFPVSIMESMAEKKSQRCRVILHPDTPPDFLIEMRKKRIIAR